jgi:DNA polymerase I
MPSTFYLIDGYAQIFRAYYAIRGGMRSPVTGEPTHAVFGFTGMLLKLLGQLQPDYIAVALDAPGSTFRDELYPAYKATRDEMPEDLRTQLPRVSELISAFGIPVLQKPGLEADDVIATVAHRLMQDPACADLHLRIVSKDKDLQQLLCDRVHMFDIHTDTLLDTAWLLENRGVRPEQVIDLLALMGDTVDNVPGVPGIGPKTAAQLIQQYGSIDGVYANLDQIKGKRRENLEASRAHLPLSRELVTLRKDGDFDFSLDECRVRPLNIPPLLTLFQQVGFNRFQEEVRRLAGGGATSAAPAAAPAVAPPAPVAGPAHLFTDEDAEQYDPALARYRLIRTHDELEALAATLRAQPMIAVDTETTGLGPDALLCGLCFSWEPRQGVYVPVRSPEPESHLDEPAVLRVLGPVLEDAAIPKCGHNLKFDARVLLRCGVRLRGAAFDSMLAEALLQPELGSFKLDDLTQRRLGYRMIPITELIGEGPQQQSIDQVPLDRVAAYAAEDADLSLRLYHAMLPELTERQMADLVREVEAPLAMVLAEMEYRGILCDPTELKTQGDALGIRVSELRVQVREVAGCEFHLDSPKQLAEVLFDRLGLAPGRRTKTGRSTDIEVLERLAAQEDPADPRTWVPRLVIEYRQLAKLINTYLGNLTDSIDPADGRIHTSFHQLVTATGRLASHSPNLQNIPVRTDIGRQIRKAFRAPPGHALICADYSQIELRILAHLSEDPALIDAFERDLDIHTAVAAQVFGTDPEAVTREQRNAAKTINFGIIYGVTPYGLARRIGGMDVSTAAELIADYKQRFPGIDRFLNECVQHALQHGYVRTLLGRRRAIPELKSGNRNTRSLGERLAINTVVQGSAADLIKLAMVNLQRRVDSDALPLRMLLQIHDELVLEAPAEVAAEQAELVRREMERALSLRVPLKAEAGIGADWMSAK